jgi:ABC-2 type transport system permease protein
VKVKYHLNTIYWQLLRSLKNMHFNLLFFLLSQLLWPIILLGTFYLSYTPLLDPSEPQITEFTGGGSLWTFLVPGIFVIYLYMEYIGLGSQLARDRDYGVLEPIFLSPVNRTIWLFGTASSVLPSGIISSTGFLLSAHFLFTIELPHPFVLILLVFIVLLSSVPWGAMVCAIFLSGRNSRLLYAIFETPGEFLSGSRFPVTALPAFLSTISLFYPLSHAVSLLRLGWYETILWQKILKEVFTLGVLAILYLGIAIFLFHWAEERGKRQGTLTFT